MTDEATEKLIRALREIAFDGCEDVYFDRESARSATCLDRGHRALACNACIARAALKGMKD
mgnify:CR=1 FL=1